MKLPYRIRQDESISIQAFSAVVMNITGVFRIIYDDGSEGSIRLPSFTTLGDRSTGTDPPITQIATQDGHVVEGSIYIASGSANQPKRGQTYVRAFITATVGAGAPLQLLIQGYLYEGYGLGLGDNIEPGPAGGHGAMRSIDLGDPAGNAEYADQTVPTNAVWRLRGLAAPLVTDGTGADRHFHIQVTDGTTKVLDIMANAHVTASLTANFTGYPGGPQRSVAILLTGQYIGVPLPEADLPEGYVLDFTTDNIQATDAWGDGQLLVEEWVAL